MFAVKLIKLFISMAGTVVTAFNCSIYIYVDRGERDCQQQQQHHSYENQR